MSQPLDCLTTCWICDAVQDRQAQRVLGNHSEVCHLLGAFRRKCEEQKSNGSALLEFLEEFSPAAELDVTAWHGKLWAACGGEGQSPFTDEQSTPEPQALALSRSAASHDVVQQLQWMPIHRFLQTMSAVQPTFGELLLGLRMCFGSEQQLDYVESYRPETIPYSEWAEALHIFLQNSHLLATAGAEAPSTCGEKVGLETAARRAGKMGC